MIQLLFAVLFLIVASAICSGVEAAIFSLPIAKARQLAEKSKNGKVVCDIREHPARPISVVVIFNNLFNIVGTFFVASIATTALSPQHQTWFPFLLTALVIVFSEIIPKTVGERFSQSIMHVVARPLRIFTWIMTPIVWAVEAFVKLLIGTRNTTTTNEQEIQALARIGHAEGVIDEDEQEMIARVFELDDRLANDIMTPRTAMTWMRSTDNLNNLELKQFVANSEHSRIVVVGESIDDIKGVLLKSRYLKWMTFEGEEECVADIMENVKLVGYDTPADDLLDYFKDSRVHLAVVVDEYGGVSGVVTLEDVLEVLTGEIMDETDITEDLRIVALKNGASKKLAVAKTRPVLQSSAG